MSWLKSKCLLLLLMCLSVFGAQAENHSFTNPIIAGSSPDPSVCRDGDDFYLVNSTFEYFPGLPVYHSKDLVNWQLIGHGLHRESQVSGPVNLLDVQSDGGIHAPSIRCHQGKFYIITTNVYLPPGDNAQVEFVNFVITADDPAGPWSEPLVLEGAPGIDPDIIFDDDGKVWYVGTHSPAKPNFPGEGEIWLQEIDTKAWKLTGKRHFLWRGACGGVWAEGPHIYKRDGRYYLMVAEGGTSFNHAVVIAVSDQITGPYISNPRNPILTSRHLSYDYWVNSVGHADLIELADGRWYAVALGIRGDQQRGSNMGRETHLVPVSWEREPFWWQQVKYEWPVIAPETGRVQRTTPLPFADKPQQRKLNLTDNFDAGKLQLHWNFRRFPKANTYSLEQKPGFLRLFASPEVISERARASLLGVRQTESDFEYSTSMFFTAEQDGVEAGINLFQKDNNYLSFTLGKADGKIQLKTTLAIPEQDPKKLKQVKVLKQQTLTDYQGHISFKVIARGNQYQLLYSLNQGRDYNLFLTTSSEHLLSKGYTGAFLGLYATSNGQPTQSYADFDWVSYQGFER